jgi:hypothetical protein
MRDLGVPLVGRDSEVEAVRRFIVGVDDGPASFVLEGNAGIGKTAIWTAAVAAAQLSGVAVRTCRCTESDAEWAFSGLGDLLDGVSSDSIGDLPEIQRQALAGALLMADAPLGSPGNRAVAVAVLGVLRALARAGPLLLAIDDIQWLDPDSRKVISLRFDAFATSRSACLPPAGPASCRTLPRTREWDSLVSGSWWVLPASERCGASLRTSSVNERRASGH